MADEVEISEGDLVECFGDTIGNGALRMTCPQGTHKVHKVIPAFSGGIPWANLKIPGNPYVTATWPTSQMRTVQ